jgi:D-glycero-alpha-D-manno-heptose-7-phosphate kinase
VRAPINRERPTELSVPLVVARAPTRIDFGGGWTDVPPYCEEQGGCVCNVAITRHASVSVRDSTASVMIDEDGVTLEAPSAHAFARDGRSELAKAALRRGRIGPVVLGLRSNFPAGAGLGGSSAAGVALVSAIAAWRNEEPDRADLAEASRALEVEELGVAGGRQDHYAAAFGGALALWFSDRTVARRIPLSNAIVSAIERRCIVAYTGQSRISGENINAVLEAYRAREPRVTTALARMRALAEDMIAALERESLDDLGALVDEHWQHQRALHARITTPEIERVLETARAAGSLGGKALGASGGGCVLLIASEERAGDVRTAVSRVAEVLTFAVDRDGVTVQKSGGEGN